MQPRTQHGNNVRWGGGLKSNLKEKERKTSEQKEEKDTN